MLKLVGPKGLGDAIYMRAVVLHLLSLSHQIAAYTYWPDVFAGLPIAVASPEGVTDFTGFRQVRYRLRDDEAPGDQFTMACRTAGIDYPIDLKLDWQVRNHALVTAIRHQAAGRRIFVFQPPKVAHNAEQEQLRPYPAAFNHVVAAHAEEWFRIKVGHPSYVQASEAECDLDLTGQTTVCDPFDIGAVADLFFGESSYLLIMAEAMDKPFLCMLTRRGLESQYERVRNIRPDRIFHKPNLATVIYDD